MRTLLISLALMVAAGTPALASTTLSAHSIKIPVLKEQLRRGQVVQAHHLALKEYDVRRLNQFVARHPDEVIGMELKQNIRPGMLMFTSALRIPPLVSRNKLVNITVNSGALTLSTKGKALQDGVDGDLVQVMNTSSNKILYATVVGPNAVEVQ